MPELPEVETVVRALRPELVGRMIRELELLHPRVARHAVESHLIGTARGAKIEAVERRGKFILVQLKDRPTLAIHLRMSGQLLLSKKPLESPHVRAILHFTKGPSLHFVDIRTFGTLFVLDGNEPSGFRDLGVEPLSSGFTVERFRELLDGRKTVIKSLLLDQRLVAGIGNIYASEALWRAKIHPAKTAGTLKRPEITTLHDAIVDVMNEAVAQMGTTLSDFRRPDGTPGEYGNNLDVYGREGEPCPRCSTPIERIVQHGRSTFFCP